VHGLAGEVPAPAGPLLRCVSRADAVAHCGCSSAPLDMQRRQAATPVRGHAAWGAADLA
jgi:hypothetical protein